MIVTKGLGSTTLITRGYGGFRARVVEAVRHWYFKARRAVVNTRAKVVRWRVRRFL